MVNKLKTFDPGNLKLVRRLVNQNHFYYGWVVLFVCFASVFFSASGQTYFTSLFVESYVEEFGWSRSAISSLYSLATLCSGLLLFLVGRLSDLYGQKKLLLLAAVTLALASLWTSNISMLWMIFIGFFFLRFSGQGSMSMLPAIIVPHWFTKRRALAFSLVSMGGAVGSFLVPPINAFLIDTYGWRMTWRIWSFLILTIFVPLAFIFLHNKPEDVGLTLEDEQKERRAFKFRFRKHSLTARRLSADKTPDTDSNSSQVNEAGATAKPSDKSKRKYDQVLSWQVKDALRTRAFWSIIYIQMLLPMIGTGITFHFISIMTTRGIERTQAPFLLSLIAMTTLVATILSGIVFSRFSIKRIALILTVFIVLAITVLVLTQSVFIAVIYAVLHGCANGVMAIWAGLVWPEYFGTRYLGSIRGLAATGNVIASALGPVPLGFIFDRFGSHNTAIYLFWGIAAGGILCAVIMPKPKAPPVVKNPYEP